MDKVYKVVIIDDEESAIDNLLFGLKSFPNVKVEGTARNAINGIRLIEKFHPDLVFLDVELPDMQGMEMLRRLRPNVSWHMDVVFYTAHGRYMIDALRASAFDFLAKPMCSDELRVVMTRFFEANENKSETRTIELPKIEGEEPFMVVTPTGDIRFLRTSEIGYFRYLSDRKMWEAALADGTFLLLKRNTTAEQLCTFSLAFVQIHQSFIINLNYLIMVQDNRCVMCPPFDLAEELTVSKKYKKEMLARFYQF